MRRLFLFLLKLVLTLALIGAALWGAGFIFFRAPAGLGGVGAIGFGLAGLAGAVGIWTAALRLPLSFAVLFLGLLGWWNGLHPSHDRNWIPEIARLPAITRDGERITVSNVRNFHWRSETDADARWETRSFDLTQLTGLDLYLSYWAGESIAHMIVSFTFADQPPLAASIEIRREQGEEYDALAGFFRSYELGYVLADERDIIGLRTHIRNEDVRLFRLRATPAQARQVLEAYIADINLLNAQPRWYNTLTTNCTTMAYRLVRPLVPGWELSAPIDPRVLMSGYLPGYLRDVGVVRQDIPLDQLIAASRISERARKLDREDPAFSAKIREGVPPGRP